MHRFPGRVRACGRGFLALAVLGAPAASAAAQDDEETIQLGYQASSGCPDQAAFVARVRARTARAALVAPGTGPGDVRAFDVEVAAGDPARGRLTLRGPHHAEGTRRVQAATCDEVVDALALVVALAIDPRAPVIPATPPTTTAPGPDSSPPPAANPAPPTPPAAAPVAVESNPTTAPHAAREASPQRS
ncbi:MAG TPA: hypothetical protein VKU41_02435, partial [Polyangiaceae bacterium]|nr:hypothetical protein [Polyangiaceae bacterium]